MLNYKAISEKIIALAEIDWAGNEGHKDTCLYEMEIVLSTAMNLLVIAVLGILLGIGTEILVYFMFFTPLRLCEGGRHAKNHLSCIGIYSVCMLLIILCCKFCREYNLGYIITGINVIISVILQLKFTRINKKISSTVAAGLLLIEIAVIGIMAALSLFSQYSLTYFSMIASGAILIQSIFLEPLQYGKK